MGSIRKIFTIAEALSEFGADFRFKTPVHRVGEVNETGVLQGDLILVASGDLTIMTHPAPFSARPHRFGPSRCLRSPQRLSCLA
jgi:hypothetical protein